MATYTELWSYLLGMVPHLKPFQAQQFVADAWESIIREKDTWSFLRKQHFIVTQPQISDGSVTVTQDSDTVTADASAKAAFDALGVDDTARSAALAGRVFRVGAGPMYEIQSYAAGVLTLERNYLEANGSSVSYQVRTVYFTMPSDFRAWITSIDPDNENDMYLYGTQEELDLYDPERTASESPHSIVAYDYKIVSGQRVPRFELYPHPDLRRQYPSLYESSGWTLSDSDPLPGIIPPELIRRRSLVEAYEWAEANRGRFSDLQGADWRFLKERKQREYEGFLQRVKVDDTNVMNSNFGTNYLIPRGYGRGAAFFQSHAPYPAQ